MIAFEMAWPYNEWDEKHCIALDKVQIKLQLICFSVLKA